MKQALPFEGILKRRGAAGFAGDSALAAAALWLAEPLPAQDWAEGLQIEGQVAFTEGPAWHAASGSVFFTDIENNRIMRRTRDGGLHVYRAPAGRANGLAFDAEGRLLACEGGGEGGNRRVTRTESDGTITVLADRFEGNRFNSPNDLALAPDGSVYFTDPRYGDRSHMEILDAEGRPVEGVYRAGPDGGLSRVIAHDVDRPNGIAVSADGRRLFVADNVNSGPEGGAGGARKLWRFDLQADGSVDLSSRVLLFDWGTERGPDGLALDAAGLVYAAAGFNFPNPPVETADLHRAGIYVIHPEEGGIIGFHAVPEDMATNCAFGGEDGKTLFITAGHKLWSLRVE